MSTPSPRPDTELRLPSLRDERITLRGHRESDLPDFFALYSDPEAMRYWSAPAWTDIEQSRERFASALAGQDPETLVCWAIADADSDQLIGGVTLFAINRTQGRAEIGYMLRSSHWRRGLATTAMRLALTHAFDQLGLRRVEADIDPRNIASCKLVERLGFVQEGLLRERWLVNGELQDTGLYGLLARDFQRAAFNAVTAGSSLPSQNSRNAPPPVEM